MIMRRLIQVELPERPLRHRAFLGLLHRLGKLLRHHILGIALSRSDGIVADAREATPKGTRNSVGRHVAEAVARVVADLDEKLGASAPVAATLKLAVPDSATA